MYIVLAIATASLPTKESHRKASFAAFEETDEAASKEAEELLPGCFFRCLPEKSVNSFGNGCSEFSDRSELQEGKVCRIKISGISGNLPRSKSGAIECTSVRLIASNFYRCAIKIG